MRDRRRHSRGRGYPAGIHHIASILGALLFVAIYFGDMGALTDSGVNAVSSRASGVGPRTQLSGPVTPSPPVHLRIASIGVSTALQPLGLLADGSLQPPTQWGVAGWYAGGIVPGQVGPAVIAGHVDSTSGPAVFYRLRDLSAGAGILVTDRSGADLSFVVDGLQRFPKDRFPTGAVYGPTPNAELRLITCIGDFDRTTRSYSDNLVVSAHLVRVVARRHPPHP